MIIHIQLNTGIGDALLVTPAFRVIKEAYPNIQISVNSRHRDILSGNPYIFLDRNRGGFQPHLPDPKSGIVPTQHHILSLWDSLCSEFDLETEVPSIKPELFIRGRIRSSGILVQVIHKNQWGGKKVWPYFRELSHKSGFSGIPKMDSLQGLVKLIAGAPLVVCAEGLISHIAAALDTPAVVIYGGFLKPEWNGYASQVNITTDVCGVDCYNAVPCGQGSLCFKSISVDELESIVLGGF